MAGLLQFVTIWVVTIVCLCVIMVSFLVLLFCLLIMERWDNWRDAEGPVVGMWSSFVLMFAS